MGSSLRDLIAFALFEGDRGSGHKHIKIDMEMWETYYVNTEHNKGRGGKCFDNCSQCEMDRFYKLADEILFTWKG